MKLIDVMKRSGRSIKSAKMRTLLTTLAIAVGAFALTLTLAASNGAQAFVSKVISDNFDPAELIVVKDQSALGRRSNDQPIEYDDTLGIDPNSGGIQQVKQLTADDLSMLRGMPQIEEVREGLILSIKYITGPANKKFAATVTALNPAQNPGIAAGSLNKPLKTGTLILPEAFVGPLGFGSNNDAVGKKVQLAVRKPVDTEALKAQLASGTLDRSAIDKSTQESTVLQDFTVAAVAKKAVTSQPGTELALYVGQQDANTLNDLATKGTNQYQKYTYAYARVKDGTDQTKLNQAQEAIKSKGLSSQSVKETQAFLNNIIGVLRGIVVAFGLIAIVSSVFGIVNTMYISVLQRTREIGLMKALGMRKRDVGRLFRFEAAWIGFIGGALGAAAAFALGMSLNPWITKQLKLDVDQRLLIFNFKQIFLLVGLLSVIAVVAGWLPSRKAAKLDPIEALRTE